jgi:hypothetical protein
MSLFNICFNIKFHGQSMVIWCDEYDIELCEWPGYSPDFNAIELI